MQGGKEENRFDTDNRKKKKNSIDNGWSTSILKTNNIEKSSTTIEWDWTNRGVDEEKNQRKERIKS